LRVENEQILLEMQGYKFKQMSECKWRHLIRTDPTVRWFVKYHPNAPDWIGSLKGLSFQEFVDRIKQKCSYGFVNVDIYLPQALRSQQDEMPSLFKNCDIAFERLPADCQQYALENQLMHRFETRRQLVSSFFAEKQLFSIEYLCFLMEMGYVITEIYASIEWEPNQRPFKGFIDTVSKERAIAAKAGNTLLSSFYKNLSNSLYA